MTSRIETFLGETGSVGTDDWDRILPLLYAELRSQAAAIIGREHRSCTLEPTALVHEAWAKLSADRSFESREHFLAVAAIAMRGILVDRARARAAEKRGGNRHRITLTAVAPVGNATGLDLVDLDDTLERYAALDARGAQGLGEVALRRGEIARARELVERSLAMRRAQADALESGSR